MQKAQKDALNVARARASELRKEIEAMTHEDIDWLHQFTYGTALTNIVYDLEKVLKAGDKKK